MIRFHKGVNLGGWLSQCDYSQARLDSFITEEDIRRIAGWGLDHVRIPIDYNVIENEDGTPREAGWARIERALAWCEACGLNTVLDLHKTAGFSFDAGEAEVGFFDSEQYQERFYRLWEEFARRYGGRPDRVAFELLNEVTEERFLVPWNRIAGECIRRIRAIAPETVILLGSYHNNGAEEVQYLDAPADDRVIYNFHCYMPLPFTHQGAYWVPWLDREARCSFGESGATEDYFEALLAPALEKAAREHTSLYCGEYGVIDIATPEDTVQWYRTLHAVLERHGIGRAAWSYKAMDFGLSDPRLDGVREELLRYL